MQEEGSEVRNESGQYRHVDVFADSPFSGNGVTVFPSARGLTTAQMQAITIEMRQFETIFLDPKPDMRAADARVFTMEEELGFAGHPALGAAAVLHERFCRDESKSTWTLTFEAGSNELCINRFPDRFEVTMDQGTPTFGPILTVGEITDIVDGLSLSTDALDPDCSPQVVSTGLPYLIVPVANGIDQARVRTSNLDRLLHKVGASFVYILDTHRHEGRTWDNAGLVEDIATGSAAGPAAAFLIENGRAMAEEWFVIHQGRFAGRPSTINVWAGRSHARISKVKIMGSVIPIARGALDAV